MIRSTDRQPRHPHLYPTPPLAHSKLNPIRTENLPKPGSQKQRPTSGLFTTRFSPSAIHHAHTSTVSNRKGWWDWGGWVAAEGSFHGAIEGGQQVVDIGELGTRIPITEMQAPLLGKPSDSFRKMVPGWWPEWMGVDDSHLSYVRRGWGLGAGGGGRDGVERRLCGKF